jgi:hypothetical protein
MRQLRFQFTLRRLLMATFCAAVGLAATMRLYVGGRDRSLSLESGWLLFLAAVLSGCLAVGVLIQGTREAIVIGAVAVLVLWASSNPRVFWAP